MKKKLLSYGLLSLFGVYLIYYIAKNQQNFAQLKHLSLGLLVLIAVGHLLGIFFNGLFVKFILRPYKKDISSGESFFVSLISTMGNYFLPVGTGTGIKAVYLKKKFQLAYSDFLSTLSGNYIIVFLLTSGLGFLSVIMLRSYAPRYQFGVLVIGLGGMFIAMLVLALYGFPRSLIRLFNRTKTLKKLSSLVSRVLDGWNSITQDRKLLLQLTLLIMGNFIITASITYIAMLALGFSCSIWVLILYTSLASLSLLLNVTPGSIGIRESMFILISTTLALSVPQILSISIVTNGVLFFVLTLSWLLLQIGFVKKRVVPPAIRA